MSGLSRVFIGWSGQLGNSVAEVLAESLLKGLPVKPWVSSLNIDAGKTWLAELDSVLADVEHAIICVTPCTLGAPWINFEAGVTYGRLKRVFILTIGESVPSGHPFSTIQILNGHNLRDIKKLLRALLPAESEGMADAWAESKGPAWIQKCEEIIGTVEAFKSINVLLQRIQETTRQLERNAGIFANSLFNFVVGQSLQGTARQLTGVVDEYSVPSDLYPEYLAAMQKSLRPRVSAIALVEQEEFFWRGQLGKSILDTISDKQSERIFVLSSVRQCIDFMPTLLQHAHKYKVHVLLLSKLMRDESAYAHDFSIIESSKDSVLATYVEDGSHRKSIKFSIDARSINEYKEAFNSIRWRARPVEDRKYTEDDIRALVDDTEELTSFEKKTVEMSTYIPIHEYDLHEEKHPYYVEMMDSMIKTIVKNARNSDFRVLELGAGTGLFTRRLAALECISEVFAVEYDWACCEMLRHKFKSIKKVIVEYQDSRIFNSAGAFNVVVSSFADHHIRPSDKNKSFLNVARNLKPKGLFIVGDEMLPEYDEDDKAANINALEAYHGHIIEMAKLAGESTVVRLETEALESGKRAVMNAGGKYGDYKVSYARYEQMLTKAGFVYTKQCIGPNDRDDDVGGVFVYVCRLRS